jgi:hypothetical protein
LRSFCAKTRVRVVLMLILLLILFTAVRTVHAQPAAQTLPAQYVTDTSATLIGVVISNGQTTLWTFAVDANGAFVENCPTAPAVVPPSTPAQNVACPLSGLQPSTTYSFTLDVCWNAWGPGNTCASGSTLTFTTAALRQYQTLTTNVSPPGSGTVTPNCPGGCQIVVGSVGDIVATPATGWAFSSWTITGATCPTGPTTNPCKALTMPNNPVSITAIFTRVGIGPSKPFDFSIALSPSSVSVNPGGTANYMILLSYSDPSYSGTIINIQLTGLGPGMDYHLSESGGLTITTSPTTPTGTYTLTVVGSASGVTHTTGGTLIVIAGPPTTATVMAAIDLALSNPSFSPPSPKVGDPVTFRAVLTILSTTKPDTYPLPVGVKATVDGVDWASYNEAISYPGPTGTPMTVDTSQHPWTATAGTHTAILEVWMYPGVTNPGVFDPDLSNNKVSFSFTVLPTTAQPTTTATQTTMPPTTVSQTTASLSTVLQTTVSPTTVPSSFIDMIPGGITTLGLVAAVIILAVAAILLSRRGRARPPTEAPTPPSTAPAPAPPPPPQPLSVKYCISCGAQIPGTAKFCAECGAGQ